MLKKFIAVWVLTALVSGANLGVRANEKAAKPIGKVAAAKSTAKNHLMPHKCDHCKVAMKAVNGTTMKCTKCGMSAPAMCGMCKTNLKAGKCPKCNMTMAQLKGAAKPAGKCCTDPSKCAKCIAKKSGAKCSHCTKDAKGNMIKCEDCKKKTAAATCAHCKAKLVKGKCLKCA